MLEEKSSLETNHNPPTTMTMRLRSLVRSKYGTSALATIAIFESLLPLPILTDPFLVTAVLLDRKRVWKLVLVTTLSSVVGGLLAFWAALYLREALFSLLSPEVTETLQTFIAEEQNTFLLTLIGAVTPVPYTIVAWAVALSSGNPIVFVIASVLGRGFRYGVVGFCTYAFGPTALRYARRSILLTSAILVILVLIYLWLKL